MQQSVALDRVEDAICKLTNVHAQVDFYVSDVVRLHSTKLLGRMDEFLDAVLVQLARHGRS